MAELPTLGKHCSFKECHQLDFLPFTCDGCLKTFCSGHRVKEVHHCSLEHCKIASGEFEGPRGYKCSLESCSNRELTPIICEKCQQSFCLSHRHAQDHQCSKLEPDKPTRGSKTAEHVQKIIEAKDSKVKKGGKGAKSDKLSAKVALMKMKMSAAGDSGCPETERVYLRIYPPLQANKEPKPMFFSNVWSIGRTVDCIADRLGIQNNNNVQGAKKLRLFSVRDGSMFPTDCDIKTLLEQEAIFNGSSVIVEYVDDTCDSLQDLTPYDVGK